MKVVIAMTQPFESGRTLPAKTVDFWFDYTCPYAYLASTQARALADRMRATLRYKPMLLGGVFRAIGTPQRLSETLSLAKAAHNEPDMQRWAKRFGVTLTMPPSHPMRSVDALRATLAAGTDPRVIDGFYRAYWVEGADIADHAVIRRVLAEADRDADAILLAMGEVEIKSDLRARTDEAIALGIFGAPAWVVDGEHLYWGQDRMHFVEGVRPAASPGDASHGAAPSSSRELEVYWDFSSPFAYLASTQVEAVARRAGAKVTWRPILLGGLFRSIGTPDAPILTFPDAKRRYVGKDLDRWAAFWGVPFRFPSRFPMVTVKALRLYLALREDRRGAYRDAVFRAFWAEDRDIGDVSVLAACVGSGPDAEAAAAAALARIDDDAVKGELRKNTESAAARGVFGVPTFIVDGKELVWGQDRLELVLEMLQKK